MSEILAFASTEVLLITLQTVLSSSESDLTALWLAFLQQELSSSSTSISALENTWLASVTSSTGTTIDLWYIYLTNKGYTGTLPDMIYAAAIIDDLFNIAKFTTSLISVDPFPHSIRLGAGFAWVSCTEGVTLDKIDIVTGVKTSIPLGSYPTHGTLGLDYGAGVVYVANALDDSVYRVDATTHAVTSISTGVGTFPRDCIFDGTNFWITLSGTAQVRKISPAGTLGTTISTGTTCYRGDSEGDNLWINNFGANTVNRISLTSESVIATINVGFQPWQTRYVVQNGYVYVSNYGGNSLSVINPATNSVIATIALTAGGGPHDIAEALGNLYIAQSSLDTIAVVNITSGSLTGTIAVGDDPAGIMYDEDYLWNTNALDDTLTRLQL